MAMKNLSASPVMASTTERGKSKFFNFLSTNRGRQLTKAALGLATLGYSSIILLKDTYCIEKYINIIRVYRHGQPLQVPYELQEKIDTCIKTGKFHDNELPYLKSFMVSGFDPQAIGSVNSSFNGYIGVPINYLYKSPLDIDKFNIKLGSDDINWSSQYGQMLERSLILTENEIEFGILKTAYELRNYNYIHKPIISAGSIFAMYMAARNINQKFDLYQKSRSVRYFAYAALGTFIYGIYALITDTIRVQQDKYVDKSLAELGPEMCETGVQFYDKLLNKNIAIRNLSGSNIYTVKGNENASPLRWTKLPLTARKLYFQQALEKTKKNTDTNSSTENITKDKDNPQKDIDE